MARVSWGAMASMAPAPGDIDATTEWTPPGLAADVIELLRATGAIPLRYAQQDYTKRGSPRFLQAKVVGPCENSKLTKISQAHAREHIHSFFPGMPGKGISLFENQLAYLRQAMKIDIMRGKAFDGAKQTPVRIFVDQGAVDA